MSERYVLMGHVIFNHAEPAREVVRCSACGALLLNGTQSRSAHDEHHLRVEAALSAAQGYELDGTPIR